MNRVLYNLGKQFWEEINKKLLWFFPSIAVQINELI